MLYLGDFAKGETVYGFYATYDGSGASITRGTDGTLSVYKDNSDTQTTTGVTSGEDTDSLTGVHRYAIATTDAFYVNGGQYFVILSGAAIDTQTVNAPVGYFTLGRGGIIAKGALSGTHSTTTADLGTNAPANDITGQTLWFPTHQLTRVVDSYNTGTGVATFSPAVAVTLTDAEPWILLASPPASTGAPVPANVTQFGGNALTAAAGIPEVKVASLATNAIVAASLASDVTTELQSGLATSAELTAMDAKLDTIQAATDNLPSDPADQSLVIAATDAIVAAIGVVDGNVDTLLAADSAYKKGAAVTAFMFYMALTDGSPGTGLTVAAEISKDGGAFAGVAGAVTEVSDGWYEHDLTGTEMTADEIALKYTATGAAQRNIKIRTQA